MSRGCKSETKIQESDPRVEINQKKEQKTDGKSFLALDRNLKSVPYVALGLIFSKIVSMPFTFVGGDDSHHWSKYLLKMVCFIFQTAIHSGFAHVLRQTVQERPSETKKNKGARIMLFGLVVLSLGQFFFSSHKNDHDELTGILESVLMTSINMFLGYLNSDLSYGFTLTILNLLIKTVGMVAPRIEILSVIVHIIVFSIASNSSSENDDQRLLSLQATIIKLFEKNQTFELMCENVEESPYSPHRHSIFYKIECLNNKPPQKNVEGDKLQYWINELIGISADQQEQSQNNVQYYTTGIPIPPNLNDKLDQNQSKDPEQIVNNIQKLFVDKNFTRLQKILDQFKEECRQRFQNKLAVPQFLKKDLFMFELKTMNLAIVAITHEDHMFVRYELYEKKSKSPVRQKQIDMQYDVKDLTSKLQAGKLSKVHEILKQNNKPKSQKIQELEQIVIDNKALKKKVKKQGRPEQVKVQSDQQITLPKIQRRGFMKTASNKTQSYQITTQSLLGGHVSPSQKVNKKISTIFNNSFDILPKIMEASGHESISEPSQQSQIFSSISSSYHPSSQESHSISSRKSSQNEFTKTQQQAHSNLIIFSESQQQLSQQKSPPQQIKLSKLCLQELKLDRQSDHSDELSERSQPRKFKRQHSTPNHLTRDNFSFGALPFEKDQLQKFNPKSKSASYTPPGLNQQDQEILKVPLLKDYSKKKSQSFDKIDSAKQSEKNLTETVGIKHRSIVSYGEVGSKITASFQLMQFEEELKNQDQPRKLLNKKTSKTLETTPLQEMSEETSNSDQLLSTNQLQCAEENIVQEDHILSHQFTPITKKPQRDFYHGRVSYDDSQSISESSVHMLTENFISSSKRKKMYIAQFQNQSPRKQRGKKDAYHKSKSAIPIEQKHSQNAKIGRNFSKLSSNFYRSKQFHDTLNHKTQSFEILENDQSPDKAKEQDGKNQDSQSNLKQYQLDHYKEKCKKLEKRVENNKIFLNMVIHDLRSPTTQVQFLVSQQIQNLKQIREKMKKALNKKNSTQSCQLDKKASQVSQPEEKREEPIEAPDKDMEPEIQIVDQNPQIKEEKQIDQTLVRESKVDDAIDISQESMGIPDEDHHILDMKNCVNSNNLNNLQQPMLDLSQIEPAKISITSAERALNEEINKLLEEKSELLTKMENKEDATIIHQIQIIRDSMDGIDKNKGAFYSKIGNKKCEHLKKKSLNELLNKGLAEGQMLNQDEEPQICSKHLSNDVEMIKYNRPYINQIDEYYQRLDKIQKKIDDIYHQQEEKQQIDAWENYRRELKFKPVVEIGESYNQNEFRKLFVQGTLNVQCQTDEVFPNAICQVGTSPSRNDLSIQNKVSTEEIKGVSKGQVLLQSQNGIIFEDMKKIDSAINSLENCGYCSTMLLTLINDLLDLAKLQKMTFELNNQFFDITNTIKNAFGTLEYFAKQKEIKPQFIISKEIEPYFKNLYGDDGRFTQIFLNFLSNAFKFTPSQGNISIEIKPIQHENFCKKISNKQNTIESGDFKKHRSSIERKQSSQNQLLKCGSNNIESKFQSLEIQNKNQANMDVYFIAFEIRIKDSGKGISKENQSKLFLNFSKLADEEGLNKQGTGLGLSICKQLIDRMGGEVRVESDDGQPGTTFVITLRAYSRIQKVEIKVERQPSYSIAIDDLSPKQKNVLKLIRQQKKALKFAKSDKNLSRIASIVLNEQRSLGFNIVHSNVQQQESYDNNLALANSRQSSGSKGVNQVMIDNISNQEQKLKEQLNQMNVLVVNDEFFILSFLKQMVEQVEIKNVDTAENGYDAYNKVLEQNYDFILCDLEMPVMNGYICAQKIKAKYDQPEESLFYTENQNNQKCPLLVACSALVTPEIEKNALAHGFDMAIQSPLTNRILEDEILKEVIARRGRFKKQILQKYPSSFSSSGSDILIAMDPEKGECGFQEVDQPLKGDEFSFYNDADKINTYKNQESMVSIRSSDANFSEPLSAKQPLGLSSKLKTRQAPTKRMNDIT